MRSRRLRACCFDAVVADHGSGEADELLREARVGDDLLVAGHRRREDRLAAGEAGCADRVAREDRAVLQDERPLLHLRSAAGEAGASAPGRAPSSLRPSCTTAPSATVIATR